MEELIAYCKRLRLGKSFIDNAKEIQADTHLEFLLTLLQAEVANREKLRRDKLLTSAGFYSIKTMSGFRPEGVTLTSGVSLESLENCEFLESHTNLVLYGNVGTGKTYLTTAIGVAACKRGISTKFFRTAALVNQLLDARKNVTLSDFIKKLLKFELLLLDELGYIPLDRTGAQLLFEVISQCYEQKSIIINTNMEFSRWVNIFYDEQMTSAILDRILHHCHLILFEGPSIRMQESSLFKR